MANTQPTSDSTADQRAPEEIGRQNDIPMTPMNTAQEPEPVTAEPSMAPAVIEETAPATAPTPLAVDTAAIPENEATASGAEITKPEPALAPRTTRSDSMAIGPAQDEIKTMTPGGIDDGPICQITLLLTTGTRHPYKIDARYLNKRNVPMPDVTTAGKPDPFSISVYTLKELILREWRADWEAKPSSPSSIRLIHFGKLLDDKEPLKTYQFSTEAPNVVHMSIRPQDLDEDEPKNGSKNAGRDGGGSTRGGGANCCVIL